MGDEEAGELHRGVRALPWVSLVVLMLVACGRSVSRPVAASDPTVGAAPAGHALSLVLDFVPTGYQAPFYLGVHSGAYRAVGLDVSIVVGKGSTAALQQIASGNDPIGFADTTSAALAISRGLPLKVVAVFLQRNPFAVIYRSGEAIVKPADLVGKTVGSNPEGAAKQLFSALLGVNGVPAAGVRMVNLPAASLVSALATRKVDAIVLTELTALPQLAAMGTQGKALLVSNWGVSALSEGLVVNTAFLAAHPAEVRSFVRVSQQAWAQAERDPQAAVAAQAEALGPGLAPKGALQTLELSFPLLHTERSAGHPLGWMAPGDWSDTLWLLHRYYGIKQTLKPSAYDTDRYIAPLAAAPA